MTDDPMVLTVGERAAARPKNPDELCRQLIGCWLELAECSVELDRHEARRKALSERVEDPALRGHPKWGEASVKLVMIEGECRKWLDRKMSVLETVGRVWKRLPEEAKTHMAEQGWPREEDPVAFRAWLIEAFDPKHGKPGPDVPW